MRMESNIVFSKGVVEPIQTEGNALLKAAWLGRLRLTRLLIEGGTDINGVNDEGQTALMIACMTKHKDTQSVSRAKMVKYLLENKADPNIKDKHGKTALMYASMEKAGHEVVKILLDHDADPRLEEKGGSSALVYAVDSGDAKVLKLLVDACKAKGKEVIIITTNNNRHHRETKQYLDVPSTLSSSPPFYKCATPSDIELRASSATPSPVPSTSSNEDGGDLIFKFPVPSHKSTGKESLCQTDHEDAAAVKSASPSCERNDGDKMYTSTGSMTEEVQAQGSVLKTRRAQLRATIENYQSDPQALAKARARGRRGSVEPQLLNSHLTNGDTAGQMQLQIPHLKGSTPSPPTSPPQRRRITRRQSIDVLQTSSLLQAAPDLKKSLSAPPSRQDHAGSCEAMSGGDLPQPRGRLSRRGSLPSMPPPLLKRQTIHNINVPPQLRQMVAESERETQGNSKHMTLTSPPRSTQSSLEKLSPTSPSARRRSPRGALLERRGSGALLLDELSQKRQGIFPPLNINPNPPLPDIGANLKLDSSPSHLRSSPKRELLVNRHPGHKPAPLLRRQSFEADHLRQLSMYMDTRSSILCSPSELSDSESEESED
ncbi:ankyrin repeat domain-containing protein 34C-like [Ptychodera flava]|uniref:ankyrin repeat domain-containing protein 34C-like n=1 Tax=Ptychodera flava TaxID=63121 RepID=UPI00396A3280